MPTFDFKCSNCDVTFEGTIPFGSKKKPVCPSCGSKKTEKLLSPPMGIVFKGSGFYKTDSSPKEKAPAEPAKDTPKQAPKADSPASNTTKK
jgi:putative FmdB family regulatory protein